MRGRYRNSFEFPEAFVPNQPTQVKFSLPDIAHTFQKGHRLMVQIQSSWFPLADRNPQQFVNIYECKDSDFIKATHKVFYGSSIEFMVK
jgi:predicted acyl esterase